ncbi:MAG TPA: divalent metal cation transporter, partial [Solirubrobacteraceae bacterium]|nr:divalent metal cation transporter [Solirubrobacteraceae bacterium]
PVLIVNQEMVIRLGAVTGVGHARLIRERFGRFWGWFSVGDLFVLNFLTIVTEFIGVSLALEYFGVSKYVAVPVAALALIAMTATGSFRRWERSMYVFVFANLLVIPLLIMGHPHWGAVVHDSFVPGIRGGASSAAVLLIIAIVGTTVAPWQLFFQQSNIVDKRITPRWINYERVDTVIGALIVVLGAGALMAVAAFAFDGTGDSGHFKDAGVTAHALGQRLGGAAGTMFAIILLNASMIGAAAVTLSTSYAFGDITGAKHSLHRGFRDARTFYTMFSGLVLVAAGIVLIPGAPLGLITTAVQALAGILLPSATVFLLMLCNDRAVLGPWVNRSWLNALAVAIIGVLVALSLILMATTLYRSINVPVLAKWLGVVLAVGLAVGVAIAWRSRVRRPAEPPVAIEDPRTWTMPPLALLERPTWSAGRRAGMAVLWGYLLLAVGLLVVKVFQLAGG